MGFKLFIVAVLISLVFTLSSGKTVIYPAVTETQLNTIQHLPCQEARNGGSASWFYRRLPNEPLRPLNVNSASITLQETGTLLVNLSQWSLGVYHCRNEEDTDLYTRWLMLEEQYYYGLSEVIYFQFNVSRDIEVSYFLDQGTLQSQTVSLFIDGIETERLRIVNEPTAVFPVTLLRNATIRFKTQHGSNTVWSYSISAIVTNSSAVLPPPSQPVPTLLLAIVIPISLVVIMALTVRITVCVWEYVRKRRSRQTSQTSTQEENDHDQRGQLVSHLNSIPHQLRHNCDEVRVQVDRNTETRRFDVA